MVLNKVEAFFMAISKVATLGLMLLMSFDALLRYFFNSPITGASAISSDIFMVIIVYFTISNCFRTGGQIRITFIRDKLNKPVIVFLEGTFSLLAGIFWFLVFYEYIKHIGLDLQAGIQPSIGFVIPRIFPDFIIALGTGLLILRLLTYAYKQFRFLLTRNKENVAHEILNPKEPII